MSKNRKQEKEDIEKPLPPEAQEEVTVIARTRLAEEVKGEIVRFAPGEKFTTTKRRSEALGVLVEVVPPPAAPPASPAAG